LFRELLEGYLFPIFDVNGEPDYSDASFAEEILFFEALRTPVSESCFFLICENDLLLGFVGRFSSNLTFRTQSTILNILFGDNIFCEAIFVFTSNPLVIIRAGHSPLRWPTLGIELIQWATFVPDYLLTAFLDRNFLFFLHHILLT
jgi:hypothetical protein